MSEAVATAHVGSNIAFIKYWGVSDEAHNLPLNNSISMTLADAYTKTTVRWRPAAVQPSHAVAIDGRWLPDKSAQRITRHLDRLRKLADSDLRAEAISENNFPMASGIASSASGFAALTVAGCQALGLEYDAVNLSRIARLGSGSACRSLFGGFVEWERGHDHDSSVAHQLHPSNHWPLHDIVAVVSTAEKRVSSENGHRLAASSPLNAGRIASLDQALTDVRQALALRDLAQLGHVCEQDTLAMHAVMMTGSPSLLYWEPATLALMHAARTWREQDGLPVYFTIDAGPNVHLICEPSAVAAVTERLKAMECVRRIIVSRPGPGPKLMANHLAAPE